MKLKLKAKIIRNEGKAYARYISDVFKYVIFVNGTIFLFFVLAVFSEFSDAENFNYQNMHLCLTILLSITVIVLTILYGTEIAERQSDIITEEEVTIQKVKR